MMTRRRLFGHLDAIPVLRQCAADRDADVRWPAVILIQQIGSIGDVIGVLGYALDDPDFGVRVSAIRGSGHRHREALPLLPKLMELTRAPELEVRVSAHWALWEIDEATAMKAGGWTEFRSDKWQFRVTMPGTPTVESKQLETPSGPAASETFSVNFGASYCGVNVTEYAPEVIADAREANRFESLSQISAAALGGTLVSNEPIEQNGHRGRASVTTHENGSTLHSRKFLAGRRLYQVIIGFPQGALSPRAESFFLNSFHLEVPPDP